MASRQESVYKWVAGGLLTVLIFLAGSAFGSRAVAENLRTHEAQEGHPVGNERLKDINRRLTEIEKRLDSLDANLRNLVLEMRESDRR
jgi:hypothetical protein